MGNAAALTDRADLIARLAGRRAWDVAVIGGGASGLGVALEAAARGFSVVLVESHDFASGTSSRATKLVHGGVRYLAQGNLALVREALRERAFLLTNAPHLARPLPFVMPSYRWRDTALFGVGLKAYDLIAASASLGPTEFLGPARTRALLPNLRDDGLLGGIRYWDGQFDDARLAIALARTAAHHGALLLNHCAVTGLLHEGKRLAGVVIADAETGVSHEVHARCVVNATGVWVDRLRQLDGVALGRSVQSMVSPSQGVHLVVDRAFLPTDHALLVPHTADGRVLFAVPWMGKIILGTTDTPRHDLAREPAPFAAEVDFILREAGRYLARAPVAADVRSCWVGLRPLVTLSRAARKQANPQGDTDTASISREHTVVVSPSGLITVTGGKWTTYRAMAADVMSAAFATFLLHRRLGGDVTRSLRLVGAQAVPQGLGRPPGLDLYGSDAEQVQALPGATRELGGGLTEAMVRFAARFEYARTVEDVLARRSRLLFLDAALAASLAEPVARILEHELSHDPAVTPFLRLAAHYQCVGQGSMAKAEPLSGASEPGG